MNISKEKFVDIFGIKKEIPSYFINNMEISVLCEFLINNDKFEMANELICSFFNHKQSIKYALFCATEVFTIYKQAHGGNSLFFDCIETIEKWLETGNKKYLILADKLSDNEEYLDYDEQDEDNHNEDDEEQYYCSGAAACSAKSAVGTIISPETNGFGGALASAWHSNNAMKNDINFQKKMIEYGIVLLKE